MKNFQLLSAIASDNWLIDKRWLDSNANLVHSLINGDIDASVFGNLPKADEANALDNLVQTVAGKSVVNIGYYTNYEDLPEGTVGIISIAGPITKYGGMCSYGSKDYEMMINKAAASSKIGYILIKFDTPGGQVSGTPSLADAIKNVQKPTLAFVDDGMMASAGVWLGVHADEIWASQKTDMIGSIGVFTQLADWLKFYESKGMKIHEVYSRLSTAKNADYKDAMKGEYAGVQDHLDFIANEFIGKVKENRGDRLKSETPGLLQGAMFYAEEAVSNGLIDRIGTLEEAIQYLQAKGNGSSADLNQAINQSNTNSEMGLFSSDKHKKTKATFEKALNGDAITEQELDQMNAELAESGVTLQVASSDEIAATKANLAKGEANASLVNNLRGLFGDAAKSATFNLEAAVADLQKDNATLAAKVEEFGGQAGQTPSTGKAGKKDDVIESDESVDFISETDAELNEMLDKYKS